MAEVMYSKESILRLVNPRSAWCTHWSEISLYKHKFTTKTVQHSESGLSGTVFLPVLGGRGLFVLPRNQMIKEMSTKQVLQDHMVLFMQIRGNLPSGVTP